MCETIVSILMPVYNGERFLAKQIASILRQTHRDFELLIRDDGSRDESWQIITSFADADQRIRATRAESNEGQASALRRLFSYSHGNRISFADQDDVWHQSKIERLAAALGTHSLVYGPSHLIDDADTQLGQTIFDHVGPPMQGRDCLGLLTGNTVSGHAILVRRDVVSPTSFSAPPLFDWRIAAAACFADGIGYVDNALTFHRIHDTNQMNRMGKEARKLDRRGRSKRIFELMELTGHLTANECIEAGKRAAFSQMRGLLEAHETTRSAWRLSDRALIDEMCLLAQSISGDATQLQRFGKKIASMTRGNLNLVYLWQEHMRR